MGHEQAPEERKRLVNPKVYDMAKIPIWNLPVRIKKIGGNLWKFKKGKESIEAMEGTPEFDELTLSMTGNDERTPTGEGPNFLVEEIDEEGNPTGREVIVPLRALGEVKPEERPL